MTRTFRAFVSRKDAALTIFSAADQASLLKDICTNSATGYVRDTGTGVAVPTHAAKAVAAHLEKLGWEA